MKFISLIGVSLLIGVYTHDIPQPDHYDILLDSIGNKAVETVPGMDSYTALRFGKTDPITAAVKDLPLINAKLTSPFIINTIFKIDKVQSSYIFLIVDGASKIKLGLDLTPVGVDTTRITLFINDFTVDTIIYTDLIDEWTKLMIEVNKDVVNFMVNCDESYDEPISFFDDISFDVYDDVHLAYGGEMRKHYFEGSIQEIKIYVNPTSRTKDLICTENLELPESTIHGNDRETEKVFWTEAPPPTPPPPPTYHPIVVGHTSEKGQKGEPGTSKRGLPGQPGKDGEPGECECSVNTVKQLLETMPSMRGPKGDKGNDGDDGSPCTEKNQGATGPEGPKGEKGEVGIPGHEGQKGEPGNVGQVGPQGPRGIPGPPGRPGIDYKDTDYKRAEKGDTGPIGPPGIRGEEGKNGEKGEKGTSGIKGEKGDQGLPGPRGLDGLVGDRGDPGLDGVPGTPGSHGIPGKDGDKGERGEKGECSDPGTFANLIEVLKTEMESPEGYTVIEKLRGFKGDVGEKGDRGDKGSPGLIGEPGIQGRTGPRGSHGEKGHRGHPGISGPRGPTGQKGEPGQSCDAENFGNTILEKGPQGDQGLPGKKGETGPRGPPGPKGAKGNIGPRGLIGPQGKDGKNGQKGEKGDSTLYPSFNIKGDKGDVGPKGATGAPGREGPPGKTAQCNATQYVSIPGPPGPPGLSITGPKGEPGGIISRKSFLAYNNFKPEGFKENFEADEDDWSSVGTLIFQSTTALIKRTSDSPLGTLAYIVREQSLLLRVNRGWQYVTMGSYLEASTKPDLHVIPTVESVPHRDAQSEQLKSPNKYLRLAALNTPFTGKMLHYQNQATAANECRRQSRKALSTDSTFVPFLATAIQDLKSLVYEPDRILPVVNIYGQLIFDSWLSMFNGSQAAFPNRINIFSFNGKNIFIDNTWPNKVLWHGGTIDGYRSSNMCNDWQNDTVHFKGTATSLYNKRLLSDELYTCNNKLIVLCIEVQSPKSSENIHYKTTRRRHQTHARNRLKFNVYNDLLN